MNKLVCKACRYCCSNEEHFTTHLKSKRHIKLTTQSSSSSSENITIQMEEKEEEEINTPLQTSNVNNSLIESLLQQNQMMMKMLMEKQNTPVAPIAKEKTSSTFRVETYLNVTCKNAINFEDLFTRDYILNTKYNKYILMVKDKNDKEILLLKEQDSRVYPSCYTFATEFFCAPFNEIPHERKPIFCSDARRGVFYVKTENKWIKMDKFDLSVKIFRPLFNHIFKIYNNIINLKADKFKKVYDKDYYTWLDCHKNPLLVLICSIEQEQIVHKIIPALCKITEKKYVSYKMSETPKVSTEESDRDSTSGSETETEEY